MQSFIQYTPTEILFGKNMEAQVGKEVRKWNGTRVLIVYGGGSVVRSGLLARVEDALVEEAIVYEEFGGVHPNPLMSFAQKGVEAALEMEADFILAVGGGSAIDTAKAIAHGAGMSGVSLQDIWDGNIEIKKSLPVGVVLTIPAAGSETSDSAVLTNEETGKKKGTSTPFNRPRFAVMNPELTYTLPKYQLTCGIVDIMMHTLDRYFAPDEGNQMTDAIAEALLRVVIENGQKAYENQQDYDSMSELMWAGSLSHNGITGLGAGKEFAVHKLGHELSARFDVAHGASLSAVWGAWATYVMGTKPERFAQYARNVWDVEESDTEQAARLGIAKTVAYFASIGMPIMLKELAKPDGNVIGLLSEEEIEGLAESATLGDTFRISNLKPLDKKDVMAIYREANGEA